jgi:ketosteroid isomerase-like protein
MSQENVEVVRRGYEYFAAQQDFLSPIFHPGFVWDMSRFEGWPERRAYLGIEGAREFVSDWSDAWEDWELEVDALIDAGEEVVAIVRQRGRSKATGVAVDMEFAQVWSVHDGLQTNMVMYADPAEALNAAGLPD